MAASAGAGWRPDAGEHLASVSKGHPSHLVLQFSPEGLRIGTGRPLHLPYQEGGPVGTFRHDIHLEGRAIRSWSPPGPRHAPRPIEVSPPGNTRPDQIVPHPGDVRRPLPLYLVEDRGPLPRLQARAVRLHKPEPEPEEGVSNSIQRTLAVPWRCPEWLIPPDEAQLQQAIEWAGERRDRLPQATGDLRRAVAALADQGEERRGLGQVPQIVAQQTGGFVIQDAQRAQDERPDGRVTVGRVGSQRPVPGNRGTVTALLPAGHSRMDYAAATLCSISR